MIKSINHHEHVIFDLWCWMVVYSAVSVASIHKDQPKIGGILGLPLENPLFDQRNPRFPGQRCYFRRDCLQSSGPKNRPQISTYMAKGKLTKSEPALWPIPKPITQKPIVLFFSLKPSYTFLYILIPSKAPSFCCPIPAWQNQNKRPTQGNFADRWPKRPSRAGGFCRDCLCLRLA